ISRGLSDFQLKDEYYYRLKFRPDDARLRPILRVPALSDAPEQQIVAWAVERADGGRGFATTTGHFFDNWKNDSYRKLMLNAIVWSSGADVPAGGVESTWVDSDTVDEILLTRPIPALVVAGESAPAIVAALNSETPRFRVKIAESIDKEPLDRYKLIVTARADIPDRLAKFVQRGGGLCVIHPAERVGSNLDYPVSVADPEHPAAPRVVPF